MATDRAPSAMGFDPFRAVRSWFWKRQLEDPYRLAHLAPDAYRYDLLVIGHGDGVVKQGLLRVAQLSKRSASLLFIVENQLSITAS